eukprot:206326-Chlamydomonas_euryale.AAC.8
MKGDTYQARANGSKKNKKKQLEKLEKRLQWGGFDDKHPPEKVTVIIKHMFAPGEFSEDLMLLGAVCLTRRTPRAASHHTLHPTIHNLSQQASPSPPPRLCERNPIQRDCLPTHTHTHTHTHAQHENTHPSHMHPPPHPPTQPQCDPREHSPRHTDTLLVPQAARPKRKDVFGTISHLLCDECFTRLRTARVPPSPATPDVHAPSDAAARRGA